MAIYTNINGVQKELTENWGGQSLIQTEQSL